MWSSPAFSWSSKTGNISQTERRKELGSSHQEIQYYRLNYVAPKKYYTPILKLENAQDGSHDQKATIGCR